MYSRFHLFCMMSPGGAKLKCSYHMPHIIIDSNSICHDFGNQLYGMHILWGADGCSICNDFAINWKWCIYHQAEQGWVKYMICSKTCTCAVALVQVLANTCVLVLSLGITKSQPSTTVHWLFIKAYDVHILKQIVHTLPDMHYDDQVRVAAAPKFGQ